ncbi:MAG: hypothetical protein HYW95_03560 [Candidatus Wildermuthbacteria bacterium]|nr:hypothetical protein [Candidatus Wildermuthbacteria bacterium]
MQFLRIEFIVLSIFLLSTVGLAFFLKRKVAMLGALPREEEKNLIYYLGKAKGLAQQNYLLKHIVSPDLLLQQLLSKVRIWALRLEAKSSIWLERLRKRAQGKRTKFSENYWLQLTQRKKKEK